MSGLLLISFSVLFLGFSPGALRTMGRNPTLTDRTEVWGVLLTLVTNPLVGSGFENFWLGPRLQKMWDLYWWHPNEAHNGYLEVYLNLGWVGIGLLFVVLATAYRRILKAWTSQAPLANLSLAYLFIGLVFNFTEAGFFKMLAPVWLFVLLAIVSPSALLRSEIGPDRGNRLNYESLQNCERQPALSAD